MALEAAKPAPGEALLQVEHLTVTFETGSAPVVAVDDVSFSISQGETLGVVGESGSGKSVTAFAILRLLQPPGRITAGRVLFQGRDLLALSEGEMRGVRGAGISLIFQEPMTALNPVMRVGDQIAEALDVTIQAQVLDLMRDLKARFNLALLIITHDFGVIAEMADRVAVMYKGKLVEEGPVRQILRQPRHEYTRSLLAAV